MTPSLSKSVKHQFEEKNVLTVSELYKILEPKFPNHDQKILKHRIRAVINTLRVSGYLVHVKKGTWKKLGN